MAKTATKSPKTTAKKSTKTTARSKATKANAKPAAKKTKAKSKSTKAKKDDSLALLDETGLRKSGERRQKAEKPAAEQRKAPRRRRQIDPTTCERDYTDQEIQFMHAMDEYKQLSGRMFPTCSEILEVLNNLGYRQVADATAVYDPDADAKAAQADDEDDDMNEVESCL